MNILLFLIPMSLLLIGIAALVFAWAVKHDQFEDLDTPAIDILREDPPPLPAPRPAGAAAKDAEADAD